MREQIGLLFFNDCKNNNRKLFTKFINSDQLYNFCYNISESKIYKIF